MTATDEVIEALVRREGGYVDHPADRGGPTKYGITRGTLSVVRGRPVSAAETAALGVDEARAIYRDLYVIRPGFDRIEDGRLREQVVDAGALHGTGWAARRLQEVAGVAVDGVIGPVTLATVNGALSPGALARAYLRRRVHRIGRIVQADATQLPFVVGWLDRATSFLRS